MSPKIVTALICLGVIVVVFRVAAIRSVVVGA
jgi:hypothetical protein